MGLLHIYIWFLARRLEVVAKPGPLDRKANTGAIALASLPQRNSWCADTLQERKCWHMVSGCSPRLCQSRLEGCRIRDVLMNFYAWTLFFLWSLAVPRMFVPHWYFSLLLSYPISTSVIDSEWEKYIYISFLLHAQPRYITAKLSFIRMASVRDRRNYD